MKRVYGGAARAVDGAHAQRLAQARALLGKAESKVGLRERLTVLAGSRGTGGSAGSASRERAGAASDLVPAGLAPAGASPAGLVPAGPVPVRLVPVGPVSASATAGSQALGEALPVPEAFSLLLPGGLPRGSVVQVSGSTSLVLALAGAACAGGPWCAVVGTPNVGWQAAAAAGLPLDRVVVVPKPGADAPLVLAALADGFDVLVVGDAGGVTVREQRSLNARLRTRGAVLLTTSTWPDAHLTLAAHARGYVGLGAGDGYLRGAEWEVSASGRIAMRQGTEGRRVSVRFGAYGLRSAEGDVADVDVAAVGA